MRCHPTRCLSRIQRVVRLVPILLAGSLVLANSPTQHRDIEIELILSRALVLHHAGDLEGAAALYVQVLRATPGAARVRSNLGAAYAALGRYDDAIDQYRRALDDESDTSIRRNLALALQKAGRVREAADEAQLVLAAEPGNRDAILILADCSWCLGESQAAIELLAPIAGTASVDHAIAYLLGRALLDVGRTDDAQAVMDPLFRDGSPEGHVLMGLMYSQRQMWAEARAELETARRANPRLALVNFLLGQALARAMDWEGAKAALRAELDCDPNQFDSNLLLGNILREEGLCAEALVLLERAARMRPDDLAVQFSLGAVYLAMGRLHEARDLLDSVSRGAPEHLPTRLQLAVLYTRLGDREKAAEARVEARRLQELAGEHSFQGAIDVVRDLRGRTSDAGHDGSVSGGRTRTQ
jgi:tetratricopeptide (TPR) repeat protein